ncbi:MAG TPA: deoxyribodipyrimidine photo-lyase [Chryseosolibacter sp.]|nr:deoxyribodipyrimidine photo-lyase [Chryseosolibacter sp.]
MPDLVDKETTIFWFRRDLRLRDNAGLYHALRVSNNVIPLFIFDTKILTELDDTRDARITFILECLRTLKDQLEKNGTSLLVLHGDPIEIFKGLNPKCVYANEDYEPYARKRDDDIKNILNSKACDFITFKDQVIFSKSEVVKDSGEPYTVFTPYNKRWKSKLNDSSLNVFSSEKYLSSFQRIKPLPLPTHEDIGFQRSEIAMPPRLINTDVITNYHRTRDIPSINGTSRLSVHLRFGTVSIRKLVQLASKKNETWLNELIWREFYQMILWHFPHVTNQCFKPAYERIQWRNEETDFQKWCDGMTGYPLVDAGMRELNQTGFMHNRVRMITASFLTKHLLIDWRWGEAYFAEKLLDYDLASNNGGWQWAAGCGCDAAPYFRIFNPELQAKRFDPDFIYIKRWVPEFVTSEYAEPIVNHQYARERALRIYSVALEKR